MPHYTNAQRWLNARYLSQGSAMGDASQRTRQVGSRCRHAQETAQCAPLSIPTQAIPDARKRTLAIANVFFSNRMTRSA